MLEKLSSAGRILVICPHFDDACYSVSGLLLKGLSKDISVLTVFSRSKHAPYFLANQLSRIADILRISFFKEFVINIISFKRRREDWKFCKRVRCSQSILLFKDSSLRGYMDPYVRDNDFLKDPIFPQVLESLRSVILSGSYSLILCPLSIRNQVDHLLVMKALLQLIEGNQISKEKCFFYEDMPYASQCEMDFINSLALERGMLKDSIYIDITEEMPIKQDLLELYSSQLSPNLKKEIYDHAKRLHNYQNMGDKSVGYCERLWILNAEQKC